MAGRVKNTVIKLCLLHFCCCPQWDKEDVTSSVLSVGLSSWHILAETKWHFPDDLMKQIFLNENVWISIKILLKFVPKGPINNIPALVQMMVWRRLGDNPLS